MEIYCYYVTGVGQPYVALAETPEDAERLLGLPPELDSKRHLDIDVLPIDVPVVIHRPRIDPLTLEPDAFPWFACPVCCRPHDWAIESPPYPYPHESWTCGCGIELGYKDGALFPVDHAVRRRLGMLGPDAPVGFTPLTRDNPLVCCPACNQWNPECRCARPPAPEQG